jgi:thiamine pyrophosphate-dependent acetolactate synthase large subunit-like protein
MRSSIPTAYPFYVELAIRQSIYGRPGAAYLDRPDDIIRGEVDEDKVPAAVTIPDPPRMQAMPDEIEKALRALESAERPLVIVGKGWPGRGRRARCVPSSSAPGCRSSPRPWARESWTTTTRCRTGPPAVTR